MKVLDHGHVQLADSCVDDLDVVNAARVSFNDESDYEYFCDECGDLVGTHAGDHWHQYSKRLSERDAGLIRFLMRERHGTPFEHGYFKFRVKAPLFVFREWHRHRAGHSYNEWSGRYSQLAPEFYVPDVVLTQTGKPGAYTFEEVNQAAADEFRDELYTSSRSAYENYEWALEMGVAKQQARLFLPLNIYSEMIWSCNPRSLMHFLSLRNSDQAQMEIRMYAQAVENIFSEIMPITHQAFIDNGRTAP